MRLESGWLYGPHLDLVVGDRAQDVEMPVGIVEKITAAAAAYPAEPFDEQRYLRTAEVLGRAEGVPGPYRPVRPHGTVELPDPPVSGPPWRERAQEVAGARLTDVVLAIAERAPSREELRTATLGALAALADSHPYGIGFGAFSLRSHAEAFLHHTRTQDRDLRGRFADQMRSDEERLHAIVGPRVAEQPDAPYESWRAAFSYCLGYLDRMVDTGELSNALLAEMEGAPQPSGTAADGTGRMSPSAFHRAVDEAGVTARPPEWFAAYRLLLNIFYRALPVVDVRPVDRYYACFAIAETVDRIRGQDWRERLRTVTRMRDAGV
ncbi:hypothetical protein ADL21_00850 [Streptomyces albus subsp. albus]|nr:hypothetical protein ADL21_00850 [Streptomyces albus subsp. albus]